MISCPDSSVPTIPRCDCLASGQPTARLPILHHLTLRPHPNANTSSVLIDYSHHEHGYCLFGFLLSVLRSRDMIPFVLPFLPPDVFHGEILIY